MAAVAAVSDAEGVISLLLALLFAVRFKLFPILWTFFLFCLIATDVVAVVNDTS